MIPKTQRFNMRVEFLGFKKHAKKSQSPHFTLYFEPSVLPLLAVVVPKKLHKSAAIRNQFRRSFKKVLLDYAKSNPHKLVVITKPIPQTKPALSSLTKELNNLLLKSTENV